MRRPTTITRRRMALPLIAMALGSVLLVGCEIAKPELPRYQTRLALPLGEERLDIAEIIADEDYLIELPDGALGFEIAGDPDSVSFDLDLGADIPAQSVIGDLGTFSLDLADPADFDFALTDLYPPAAGLDGMTVPVPPFGFTSESAPENIEDVDAATLAGGTLTVTVSNGLPVPVSAFAGPDRLVLDLVDPGTGTALVTIEFDPIPAGGQAQETADLAGVVLPGGVAVRLVGGSPGSSGSPVLVDAAAAVAVHAEFSDLEVTAAQAVVGPQEFTTSFLADLPDDYEVQRATIQGGSIQVSIQNQMPIPCIATVTWPDVVDLDDDPMQVVIPLAGGASDTRGLDFAGYIVQAPPGTALTELVANVDVTSPGSGSATVALDTDMGLRADLSGGRIQFGSVTGLVPETVFELDAMNEEVDLPDELEGVSLTRATLVLELTNTAGLDATADLELTGTSESGSQRTMIVHEPIAAADAGRSTVTSIVLDETNSTIVDFLNNLPTQITLAGDVQLGGNGQVGTVHADDYALIDWRIEAPAEVVIASSHLYGDAESLDLDTDTRDLIADHLGAAELQMAVYNHLPVGIETRLLFGNDPETIKTAPLLAIGPLVVDAGTVDPSTGEVTAPRTSEPLLTLTATQTQVLATEGLYSMLEVVLPSTDGQTVRVLSTDHVTIQGLIYVDVDVHDSDM